jgi:hypothetical protein
VDVAESEQPSMAGPRQEDPHAGIGNGLDLPLSVDL